MRVSSRREFIKLTCLASLAAMLPAGARAGDEPPIQFIRAELVPRGDAYHLIGGYQINLTNAMEEALQRGVPLYFVQLFQADRPRDFWLSEEIADIRRILKLSHNALLRTYQISSAGNIRTFDTIPQALGALGSFDEWHVFDKKAVQHKYLYQARVRMYLDTSQLPKPLQINAFTSNRWDLDSDWREWSFKP
jgi:hypothetical protein